VRYAQERDRGRILELQPGWAAGTVVELVFVDENDRCVMAAGAWRLAEVHLAADAAWMTPRWRMEALRALHEQMRLELQTLGYVEAVTWLDVAETLRGFGRGLLRRLTREFGWVASERTSYHRRVR
jgi:hypothetical protein